VIVRAVCVTSSQNHVVGKRRHRDVELPSGCQIDAEVVGTIRKRLAVLNSCEGLKSGPFGDSDAIRWRIGYSASASLRILESNVNGGALSGRTVKGIGVDQWRGVRDFLQPMRRSKPGKTPAGRSYEICEGETRSASTTAILSRFRCIVIGFSPSRSEPRPDRLLLIRFIEKR